MVPFALIPLLFPSPASRREAACPADVMRAHPLPAITVAGAGEVTAKPDRAELYAGAITEAGSAQAALAKNTAAMERVLKVLEDYGIEKTDVQTVGFDVAPQYRHDPAAGGEPRISGYQVMHRVHVNVRDLSVLGSLLDAVVAAGANRVDGVRFTASDAGNLADEARRRAIASARRNADVYARAAGMELGRPLSIREEASERPRPVRRYAYKAALESAAVPIEPGEETIRAAVEVTWELRPAGE